MVPCGDRTALPDWMFLHPTPLTPGPTERPDRPSSPPGPDRPYPKEGPLARMHPLMAAIHEASCTTPPQPRRRHAEGVLRSGRGVCQDHAHSSSPAPPDGRAGALCRGHLLRRDGGRSGGGARLGRGRVEDLGWVGFDPANGICATERYVRVATGLDYLGAAPVRGATTAAAASGAGAVRLRRA